MLKEKAGAPASRLGDKDCRADELNKNNNGIVYY